MAKQEIIRTTVPVGNEWHTEDLEAKAESLGMSKSELILMATNLFMHLTAKEVRNLDTFAEIRRLTEHGLKAKHVVTLTVNSEDNE